MKLSNLQIRSYKQFDNFKIDLTYPDGHPKEGQPLDRVCFIGQSGVGKSNLLKILMHAFVVTEEDEPNLFMNPNSSYTASFLINRPSLSMKFKKHSIYNYTKYHDFSLKSRASKNNFSDINSSKKHRSMLLDNYIQKQHIYYYPAQSDYPVSLDMYNYFVNESISSVDELHNFSLNKDYMMNIKYDKDKKVELNYYDLLLSQVVYCHYNMLNSLSNLLLDQINKDIILEQEMRLDATYKAEEDENFNLGKYIREWKNKNPGSIEKITNSALGKLLNDLNIAIDFKNFHDEKNIGNIFKVNKSENYISFNELSSGSRQLINMLLPLLIREPQNSVILVDEPETSLFPDIQRKIVSLFTSIGKNNQCFFSTHSPIVASAFDPVERFYIYFEKGKIICKHGVSPEGDDPNDLLYYDFGLNTVLGEKGEAMYNEYLQLRRELKFETNDEKKDEIANRLFEIGNKYGFEKLSGVVKK